LFNSNDGSQRDLQGRSCGVRWSCSEGVYWTRVAKQGIARRFDVSRELVFFNLQRRQSRKESCEPSKIEPTASRSVLSESLAPSPSARVRYGPGRACCGLGTQRSSMKGTQNILVSRDSISRTQRCLNRRVRIFCKPTCGRIATHCLAKYVSGQLRGSAIQVRVLMSSAPRAPSDVGTRAPTDSWPTVKSFQEPSTTTSTSAPIYFVVKKMASALLTAKLPAGISGQPASRACRAATANNIVPLISPRLITAARPNPKSYPRGCVRVSAATVPTGADFYASLYPESSSDGVLRLGNVVPNFGPVDVRRPLFFSSIHQNLSFQFVH
jgi:hypothetical protein